MACLFLEWADINIMSITMIVKLGADASSFLSTGLSGKWILCYDNRVDKSVFVKVENEGYRTRNEMEENNEKLHGKC